MAAVIQFVAACIIALGTYPAPPIPPASAYINVDPCQQDTQPGCATEADRLETRARAAIVQAFEPADVELAVLVAWCESRWEPAAKHPVSSASGLFQMMPGWWTGAWNPALIPAFDPFDIWANASAAAVLYYANGSDWRDWTASKGCWQ